MAGKQEESLAGLRASVHRARHAKVFRYTSVAFGNRVEYNCWSNCPLDYLETDGGYGHYD
jgi:hypothetical protein